MTQQENLRAVFDCNIFFQATRNANGPAAKAFRLLDTGTFSLFVSSTILEEVRETFTDPDLRAKNRWLTDEVVDALFEHLGTKATLIHNVPEQFSYQRDPDDAQYVNLALTAGDQIPCYPRQGPARPDERRSLPSAVSRPHDSRPGCLSPAATSKGQARAIRGKAVARGKVS